MKTDTTVISVKVKRKLKDGVQKISRDMGVPMSILINNYFRRLMEEKGEYFAVSYKKEVLKPHVAKRLAKIHEDIKNGRNLSPAFDNAKDAIEWLRSK